MELNENKKELPQIIITGVAGSGKSTLARLISEILTGVGIETEIEDIDGPLDNKLHYAILCNHFKKAKINIKVVQTQRKV